MTPRNPNRFDLSASSIASFKACPTRFRLAYREGLRLAEDTDAQRMGTNWHALHEVYWNALLADPTDTDGALEAGVAHLNERYQETPPTKTPLEWEVERQTLLMSFMGYLWHWESDPIVVLDSELAFDLPLHTPRKGMPLPVNEVVRRGKIDHIILWHGMIGNLERKSTSRNIDPSGDFWERAEKDTQVSMYALAFRDLAMSGQFPDAVLEHGAFDATSCGNTLYDVWHKPTIKPANLTQTNTAVFLDTHTHHDQTFEVRITWEDGKQIRPSTIEVDEEIAEFTVGKSGKAAIRETAGMFGARLLADIQERPDFYYQRKEIARTDQQLQRFRTELFNIYEAQRMYDRTRCWFENEQQCRATFPCQYIPICYGPGADHICESGETPPNFHRIFVDATVNNEALTEE